MSLNPRIVDTDSDGTPFVGTIHNNAWLQALEDLIDARWSVVTITSTGTQNNLSIADSGGHDADFVIFNNATDLTITGIAAPSSPAKPGKPLRYVCIGAGNVFFADSASGAAATSTATNRIICIAKSGNTPHAGGAGCGMVVYDTHDVTSSNWRWRLVLHEQGDWITPTFAAGSYTGASSQTWTLDSGDVVTQAYYLRGRTLTVSWNLLTTTVGGTPALGLQIGNAAWGSFTIAKSLTFPDHLYEDAGGANTVGFCIVTAADNKIQIFKISGNWSAATNTTATFGQVEFDVQ